MQAAGGTAGTGSLDPRGAEKALLQEPCSRNSHSDISLHFHCTLA